MFCPKCGKEIREGSQFCVYCGERIETPLADNTSGHIVPQASPNTEVSGSHITTNPFPDHQLEDHASGTPTSTLVGEPQLPVSSEQPQTTRKPKNWGAIVAMAVILTVVGTLMKELPKPSQSNTPNQTVNDVTTSWIDYASEDAVFTVRLPAIPEKEMSSNTVAGVATKTETYTSDTGGNLPWYTVVVYKLPGNATAMSEPDAGTFLGGMVGGMSNSGSWSLVSDSAVTKSDGYYRKDFVLKGIADTTGLYMVGRAFIKDANRMYLLLLTARELNPLTRDPFFESFKLK
jgi:hypothetical protein